MKAILCQQYGPIKDLEYTDVDDPVPAGEDVVIRCEAIGVNYPDGLLVQGLYQARPPMPFVPGMEAVGEIVAIGDEVIGFKPGDRVAAIVGTGAYAEMLAAPQSSVLPLPENVDGGEVTALICGYGTAHHALKQRATLREGETLVVTGAAGLTGLAAVQLGKLMGAKVIAVASSEEKRQHAKLGGADIVLGYENLKEALKEETRGKGVDVAFDVVGGEVFDDCARAMAWNGRLLVVGFASGQIPQFPVNLALVKGFSVVGVYWGSFVAHEAALYADNMTELTGWYMAGEIKPHVEKVYPLAQAVEALKHIHERKALGKLVLKP